MNKITVAIMGIVIAVLAGFVVLQQQKIQQLGRENASLSEQAGQLAPLQQKLDETTQAAANAASSVSESAMHGLARLRNEVTRLRQASNELVQARQQINVLNDRVTTEAAARSDAMQNTQATVQAQVRQIRNQDACINNLRLIDSAKQQWALEKRKQNTDTPEMSDLQPYIGRGPNGEMPVCPDGGVYTYGTVGEKPVCSTPGHALP
jgi:ABC-type transporter Mla subunit MlaD